MATPDVVECSVARADTGGAVVVTIPRMEVAGYVLLTTDEGMISWLRERVARIPAAISRLAVAGSLTQTRQMSEALYENGFGEISGGGPDALLEAARANERAHDGTP